MLNVKWLKTSTFETTVRSTSLALIEFILIEQIVIGL